MTPHQRIRRKSKRIEGNRPLRVPEICRNPATIAFAKFFRLHHRGFDRASTGCRISDRVGPEGGRRWSAITHFLNIFFPIFSPDGADSSFQTCRTHTRTYTLRQTEK